MTSTASVEPAPATGLRRLAAGLAIPITAMPAAGLLLRAGQHDLLGRVPVLEPLARICAAAGGSVFDYLPLLFALGVAAGLARRDTPQTMLAAGVAYLMLSRTLLALDPLPAAKAAAPPAQWPYGVLAGLAAGVLAAGLWHALGQRGPFARYTFLLYGPLAVSAAVAGSLLALAFPAVDGALTVAGTALVDHTVIGGGIFGALTRLLLPVGLHQVPAVLIWYGTGTYHGVTGDLPRFFRTDDPTAGAYMTGFFPVMMFALPAACVAMWHCAPREHRRWLLPAAALSFALGVTEPIELVLAFTATRLYAAHAVLTGLSLALVNALGIRAGFTFSAGAVDYALNFPLGTRPWLLPPIGLAFAGVYYGLFRYAFTRWYAVTGAGITGRQPSSSPPLTASPGQGH